MRERSVTRAGRLIGLSQPAMSHALNRLRHMLGDELFVRTPDGMTPTPRAEAIAEPLRNALSEMQLALEPLTFDPQASDRTFTLGLNNFGAVVLAPPLVEATYGAAPGVRLDMRPSGTLDIAEGLDRGEFDLAIGSHDAPGERFACELLLEDQFVLVMRRGHPASRRKLTAAALAELSYLEISSSG
jgi:DNA-binding transcriptional LysR family regulator